jgi:non-lysosomal glucosylceramidase
MQSKQERSSTGRSCGCSGPCGGIERRDFLKFAALGAAAAVMPNLPVAAGPFEASDFEALIPGDKKLDPAWVKSLFARGEPTVYRGAELAKIGMPVGGICAGQLYLGGDGRLWHWDVFNQQISTADAHYAAPLVPSSPLEQGFGIRILTPGESEFRRLDHTGFADISFCGEYPIATVEYRDSALPITVSLEAFSPFVPLNTDDSSLPATVLRYTVKNVGKNKVEASLIGWLENAVGLFNAKSTSGRRVNHVRRDAEFVILECSAVEPERKQTTDPRPDVVFEDFQKETYEGWQVTGEAIGKGPILKSQIPAYQGDVGSPGPRVVNSHASAPGDDVGAKDAKTGALTSREFSINRSYINFWIGGGRHPGKTCINLLVDGKTARSATGHDGNAMRRESMDVSELQGKTARLQIVDNEAGAWGNIGIAEIVLSDTPAAPAVKLQDLPDFGTMAFALLEPRGTDRGTSALDVKSIADGFAVGSAEVAEASEPFDQELLGGLARTLSLDPGESASATFVLAWHFPNLSLQGINPGMKDHGRYYATRFASATDVARHVAKNFDSLAQQTRLWHDTWYDSTLPHWFLERTFANASILATSTCHRFESGRFYGWEGVGCCEGTCTHVWHYAQAMARLFPDLERDLRKRVDFGLALNPQTGVINHRGEGHDLAVDGQAGCILRAYREHQMSSDDRFLRELWPKIKAAMQCLVRMDDGEGILEGPQHNTLDQPWFGKVAWLSSLYIAAARACEEMAKEMGDEPFARQMQEIVERGGKNIDGELFNGEYYLQIADAPHKKSVGSHDGCEVDQVFGQSWAFQVGLGRILYESHVKKALESLWKYNFTPDVGRFRQRNKPGRWYAMAGEGGLVMCSWPHGDAARVPGGFDLYFNECMNGFEHQVAGHMIWEGMVEQGLAVERMLHDRYHAARRNPWNEVECGDHYARSMASYGVFLAACGYEHDGPRGNLGFAPKLTPEDYHAPFTTARGWGTFSQTRTETAQHEILRLKWGELPLSRLAFELPANANVKSVRATHDGGPVETQYRVEGNRLTVLPERGIVLRAGEELQIAIVIENA